MINTVTPAIAESSSAAEPSQLLQQIARRADVNRDGAVAQSEFAGFLNDLMESLDREAAPAAATDSTEGLSPEPARFDSREMPAPSPAVAAAALRAAMLGAAGDR